MFWLSKTDTYPNSRMESSEGAAFSKVSTKLGFQRGVFWEFRWVNSVADWLPKNAF